MDFKTNRFKYAVVIILFASFCLLNSVAQADSSSETWRRDQDGKTMKFSENKSDDGLLNAGLRMVVSLLLVLGLLIGGVYLLKKITPYKRLISGSQQPLSLLSKIAVAPRTYILIAKIADEILVIGLANNNMTLLSKMDAEEFQKKSDFNINEGYGNSSDSKQTFRKFLDRLYIKKENDSLQ
ncbi:hypothetical protein GF312_07010 [Candidatus Poribacteria bacterium]|nr:hypothetical protein [Candidatus Poribacteria bacterium]